MQQQTGMSAAVDAERSTFAAFAFDPATRSVVAGGAQA